MLMYPKKQVVLVLILVLSVGTGFSQHQRKACFLCKDATHYHHHESPYKPVNFKSELPILGSMVGLTTVDFLLAAPPPLTEVELLQLEEQDVNAFDRYAISKQSKKAKKLSDLFLTGVLVLPAVFLSNHHTRQDIIPLLTLSVEVVALNYSLTIITKKLAQRTRPLAYNPAFSLEERLDKNARASFYSGHTSHTAALSFLMAKVMTDYHPDAKTGIKIGIWTFAASIPALTGYWRVRAGKHFPTDTIVGYLAGGLIGIAIPHFHKRRIKDATSKIRVQPTFGLGMASVTMYF